MALAGLGVAALAGIGALVFARRAKTANATGPARRPFRPGAATIFNADFHQFEPLPEGGWLVLGSDGVALRFDVSSGKHEQSLTPTDATLSAGLGLGSNLVVLAGAGGCILRSRDGGRAFEQVDSAVGAHLRALVRDPRGVLAVGDGGAATFGSLDGSQWRAIALGTRSDLGHARLIGDRWILLAGSGGSVLRGDPVTGFREDLVDDGASITCSAALANGAAIVGTEAGAVHVALNETAALKRFELGSREDFPSAIAATTDGRGCVVATSRGRFHFSEDGGEHFTAVDLDEREYVSALGYAREGRALWAVCSSGAAYRRGTETGKPERFATSPEMILQAVHALDATRAWAAGKGGGLVRLQAGRGAELVRPALGSYLNGVALEPERGVLVAVGRDSTVARSTDGGLDWRPVTVSVASATTFFGVAAGPRGTLFLFGSGGALLRSEDGGNSFEPVNATRNAIASMLVTPERILALSLDEGPLWSDDGGRRFQKAELPRPASLSRAILGAHADCVVAIGERGQVAVSNDGGESFYLVQLDAQIDLRSALVVPSSGRVLVCGTKGALFGSNDGGRAFELQTSARAPLNALAWHEATRSVFAFGNKGAVLRSRDEGVSFEPLEAPVDQDLRSVVVTPDAGLLAFGSGGAAVRVTPSGSLERVLTHSRAGFSDAAFNRDGSALLLVGARIVRLENAGA